MLDAAFDTQLRLDHLNFNQKLDMLDVMDIEVQGTSEFLTCREVLGARSKDGSPSARGRPAPTAGAAPVRTAGS
ncbi:hypothetical protein [Streptomyces sp. NPDC000410]|uniref:hypothetical protein n=1 Tax=Streptomyces sp. NPDC000410 TaxID=3154254 RepID=UPI0033326C10